MIRMDLPLKRWMTVGILVGITLHGAGLRPVFSQVVFNEILADNQLTVENGDRTPDYIEIFNWTGTNVNLEGIKITDDILMPSKFVFPPGIILGPGDHLRIWADDNFEDPGLHTGFGLNNNGEQLSMISSNGFSFLDTLTFGLQLTDLSIGRIPDGFGQWTLNQPTPGAVNTRQNLAGPERLFINEWAALDLDGMGEVDDDWLEIYNATNLPVSLGGLLLGDTSTNHPLVSLSFIGANDFIRFFADDSAEDGANHLPFKLSSSRGETLTLFDPVSAMIVDQVIFGPQSADITQGRLPDGAPPPYRFFSGRQRTPGASNFLLVTNVVINEIIAHTDIPLEDAIELHNPTDQAVDISHWFISDDRDEPNKFQVPDGTTIPPGGFIVFYERPFLSGGFNPNGNGTGTSFSLNSAEGDEVNLFPADMAGNLTGQRLRQSFGPSLNGVSLGRVATPNDTNFVSLTARTFGEDDPPLSLARFRRGTGKTNAPPRVGPVVISEIMYHPTNIVVGTNIMDNDLDEFVEILNITDSPQLLYDPLNPTNNWQFKNAINYTFPSNVVMAPGEFILLVNFDPMTNITQLNHFQTLYSVPQDTRIFGPYGGKLGNGGEALELKLPDRPQTTGANIGLVPFVDVDQINYDDEFPWSVAADGMGFSLQRRAPSGYGNDATNWIATLPTPGRMFSINLAPILTPIANIVTNEWAPIIITNVAVDPDGTNEDLVFTLDPPAHTNATISADGVFHWHSTEVDGPGIHSFTIRVTDTGTPPQSATQTFSVALTEHNNRPRLTATTKYAKAGTLMSFMAATDPDLPANNLSFTLEPGFPTGLSIHPSTGEVTWTPTDAQAPGLYAITVNVTDDGLPNLSNSRQMFIEVLDRQSTLVVVETVKISNLIILSWDATVGKRYQIQQSSSTQLPITWSNLGLPRFANVTDMKFVDVHQTANNRYYRIIQID